MWTCHEIDQFASCAKWSGAQCFQFWIDLILFDWVALTEVDDSFDILFLLLPPVITVSFCNSQFVSFLCQSGVCIILSEENSVFSSGGEHSVWLVHAFCREVIDKNADIAFVSLHFKCLVSHTMERSIDSSNSTLTAGFFVSCRSIYLACEEKTFYDF